MTSPTTVFLGGRIITAGHPSRVEAVSVRDGRIEHVGAASDVRAAAGSDAVVVDLEGGTLLPGFQDAHVHPLDGGLGLTSCDLTPMHGLDAYLATINAWATAHPEATWVQGAGWYRDVFPGHTPHRRDLDRVVPDRPAYFNGHDGHTAWVNSRALAIAGITRTTPDPTDGHIDRDVDGEPTGVLTEGAAALVADLLPQRSRADLREGLLAAQRYLHSLGVTAWQDAIVGDYLGMPDPYDIYRELDADGLLTARVRGALWWQVEKGLDQLPELLDRRAATTGGRFHAGSVKVMQDGICENCTGAMLAPYLGADGRPGADTGMSLIEPNELCRIATLLHQHDFQVHFHGVGDRAVRECLDAVEVARATGGPRDLRHQIAHLDVVDPTDLARFAELEVVANIQPLWARRDAEIESTKLPLLGEARARHHFPFGAMASHGARLAMGSDWPVSSPDPLWALHTAVHRTAPAADPHANPRAREVPLGRDQALSPEEAIAAYTTGSAYANHLDEITGSIARGKLADLVVVDVDLADPAAFEKARVRMTFVDGRLVHEA